MKSLPELNQAFEEHEAIKQELARRDFLEYRKYINPKLKIGWFVVEVANELQQFYEDLMAGKAPILILETPPQHGKSIAIVDFVSWVSGKHPDLLTIFTSFSDRLGVRANLKLQRIYQSERYKILFPELIMGNISEGTSGDKVTGRFIRNKELIEYSGREGSFRNTTIGGHVTGETLDLAIIDDPMKGREAANSLNIRNKTWDWLTDDLFTRFNENAGMILILTRWHIDDVAARLKDFLKGVKTITFKAIADEDEKFRKAGEALFPEHKSLEFLLKRKMIMGESNWLSLYQQTPIIAGGGMIKINRIEIVNAVPNTVKRRVRYWDKAGTQDGGCNTAGVRMSKDKDNIFYVEDVQLGQWSALAREDRIKQTAQVDGTSVTIYTEQEGGSGGKESAETTVRNLSGFTIKLDRVTGDKVTRAEPLAAQIEAGNVKLLKGEWNRGFLAELESFPHGKFKDQVDAASGAFNKLALENVYGFTEKQIRDSMNIEKTTDAPSVDEVMW